MRILKISKVNTFLVGIMMLAILLCCSSQVQAAQDGDYTYTQTAGKAQITGYTGPGGVVTIPSTLGGFPVTSISSRAFYRCTGLTNVSFPEGITSIGDSAFSSCTGLRTVNLLQGVTSIGSSAFSGCISLTTINLPQGVTNIGSSTFSGCTSLTSISLPQGVTNIGSSTFSGCTSLTSISLPQGVISIGDSAFQGCTGLNIVNIPQGVTSIGRYAFSGCTGLSIISLSQGLTSIGYQAFQNCTGLGAITLPLGLTSIGDEAFQGCTGLSTISLPQGLTSIGTKTFRNCIGLSTISLPQGLTRIGDSAFSGCIGLNTISFQQGLSSIGANVFSGCISLTAISLPQGLTSIGSSAFSGCISLTTINLPQGLTSIDNSAFSDCISLTTISLPQGLTRIGDSAFQGCTGLNIVTIPLGVTIIGNSAFSGCTSLSAINLPQGVSIIDSSAFRDCTALNTVTIPLGVAKINDRAFDRCTSLVSIRFNSVTTTIYDSASTIPASTKIIGYDPSTAKTYATKYNRTFEVIDSTTSTLQSIAITTPATKLSYTVGDALDITGLVVTGTYSDGSTKIESITAANISGFNSTTAAADQVLTITVGTKTTTYKVQIVAVPIPVTEISLNKSSATVTKGNSEQLVATVSPSNATNKNVSWVSNNPSIATVNSTGLVTAMNPGITVITVSTEDGNKTATCIITVTEAQISVVSVSLNKSSTTVTKGNTEQLVATVSPSNATNQNVSWVSNDPSIATVNSTGLVTAMNLGITVITVSTEDGNKIATCIITVTEAQVSVVSVSLNKSSTTVTKGNTEQLVATVSPSNATNQNVSWVSNDPSIATVNSTGLVTAVNPGITTITVSTIDGNKTAACIITVTEALKNVSSLIVTPSDLSLSIGETKNITLTATYTDNSTEDVTESATWTSSKPSVAIMNLNGSVEEVTGLMNGSTIITGSYGGKTATVNVKVSDGSAPVLDHLSVQPESVCVAYGKTQTLKIFAVYSDDSEKDVTKSVPLVSDDPTTATVTGGKIKGISVGDTFVRGTYQGLDIDISVTVTPPVTKLSADPTVLNLLIDETETITLTAIYKGGTEADVTGSVWKSRKPQFATVDADGNVTGVAIGSTTITGTYGGKTATINVNVLQELDHFLVLPSKVGVAKGKTQLVTIYAVYVDGTRSDITKMIRLTSDDTDVATVTGTLIKGITADGETIVRGTYLDQDIEIPVKVTQPLKTLEADTETSGLNLSTDQSETITLTATYSDGTTEEVNEYATCISSKPSIALVETVDGEITVTGVKAGSATITLSYEGKKVTIKVKVTA